MLKSGDLELTSIKLLDTQVHRYGDSAVLTGAARPNRSVPGAIRCAKDIVYRHVGFGTWEVASGRSASDCRALLTDSARDAGLDERLLELNPSATENPPDPHG